MARSAAGYYTLGLFVFAMMVPGRSNMDFDHDFNGKFFDTLMKTKDSRTFLNDLINKIQLLLNDTDENSFTGHGVASAIVPKITVSADNRPPTTPSVAFSSQTGLISKDSVMDAVVDKEMTKMVSQETNQRAAILGVIICLTFAGTATCIVVMALYSSKFSSMILLSNDRWWCPMVRRRNGIERQLLV